MATHAGSEGVVTINNQQMAEVKSWNIEEVSDTVDASVIGTQWRKSLATIKSWSGSIDAFWDDGDDDNAQKLLKIGATIEVKLYPNSLADNPQYFTGHAIVTGISRQGSFDGIVESSFTFQGNGELKSGKNVAKLEKKQEEEHKDD
ncbi:MAG: hypothetical protein DGJ47_000540 [Rickettsiaceae bacterium]